MRNLLRYLFGSNGQGESGESDPNEITPAEPPERSPPTPAHSVDKPSTSRPNSDLKDFPREFRIAGRVAGLVIGVWIIVDALVYDSIMIPRSGGKHTGFEEDPLLFLLGLAMGFFIVGWSISPILRALMSKFNHN
jgi:hypothetical protein